MKRNFSKQIIYWRNTWTTPDKKYNFSERHLSRHQKILKYVLLLGPLFYYVITSYDFSSVILWLLLFCLEIWFNLFTLWPHHSFSSLLAWKMKNEDNVVGKNAENFLELNDLTQVSMSDCKFFQNIWNICDSTESNGDYVILLLLKYQVSYSNMQIYFTIPIREHRPTWLQTSLTSLCRINFDAEIKEL